MMELVTSFTKESFESVVIAHGASGPWDGGGGSWTFLWSSPVSTSFWPALRLWYIMRHIKITVDIKKAAQIKRFGHLWVEANWASWLYSVPLWDWESKPSALTAVSHWDFHSPVIDNKTTLRPLALAAGIAETPTIELFTTPLTLCNYASSVSAEFTV